MLSKEEEAELSIVNNKIFGAMCGMGQAGLMQAGPTGDPEARRLIRLQKMVNGRDKLLLKQELSTNQRRLERLYIGLQDRGFFSGDFYHLISYLASDTRMPPGSGAEIVWLRELWKLAVFIDSFYEKNLINTAKIPDGKRYTIGRDFFTHCGKKIEDGKLSKAKSRLLTVSNKTATPKEKSEKQKKRQKRSDDFREFLSGFLEIK